ARSTTSLSSGLIVSRFGMLQPYRGALTATPDLRPTGAEGFERREIWSTARCGFHNGAAVDERQVGLPRKTDGRSSILFE
ncbi:MAG: hypothetical protein KDB10_16360, partial [Acidimicrobiales bacterium]|nr:hypothetical protein [Acidimicrobiales bacterium]